MDENKNIISSRLREARCQERPKTTQNDISARLQILGVTLSASSIGRIEKGQRAVTDMQLVDFAKALNVIVAWLLGEEPRKQR